MDAVMKFSCFLLSSISTKTDGQFELRYYQENAVNAVVKALSEGKKTHIANACNRKGKNLHSFSDCLEINAGKVEHKKTPCKTRCFFFWLRLSDSNQRPIG